MSAADMLLHCVRILGRRGHIPRGVVLEIRHNRELRLPTCTVKDAITIHEHRHLRGRV